MIGLPIVMDIFTFTAFFSHENENFGVCIE